LEPTHAEYLSLFPDNNVYMGLYTPTWQAARYVAASDQMDRRSWIGLNSPNDYFDASTVCASASLTSTDARFCGDGGAEITWSYNTGTGSEFVLAGASGDGVTAMQWYPTVRFLPSEVKNVTVAQGVGSSLLLAGLDANNKNVLTLYNTTDDAETQLIGPGNEIEIYHLNHVANGNKVLFDGLRFSDNSYVIGEVDLSTDQVSIVDTSSVKWADLQTFG
jgi:hypothetical protein